MSEMSSVGTRIAITGGRATLTDYTGKLAETLRGLCKECPKETRFVADTDEAIIVEMPADWIQVSPSKWELTVVSIDKGMTIMKMTNTAKRG